MWWEKTSTGSPASIILLDFAIAMLTRDLRLPLRKHGRRVLRESLRLVGYPSRVWGVIESIFWPNYLFFQSKEAPNKTHLYWYKKMHH